MSGDFNPEMQWTLEQDECVFQGFFSMHRLHLRHQRFDGSWTPGLQREVMYRGPAVGVLAYDPQADAVVMVEQFRPGALHHAQGPWLLELIAGMVAEGETPAAVARREAMEEAGLTLGPLTQIARYFSSPGGCDEEIILFYAPVDTQGVGGVFGLAEEQEETRVWVLPREEAWQEAQQGRAANAMSLIGLQWLQANYREQQQAVQRT